MMETHLRIQSPRQVSQWTEKTQFRALQSKFPAVARLLGLTPAVSWVPQTRQILPCLVKVTPSLVHGFSTGVGGALSPKCELAMCGELWVVTLGGVLLTCGGWGQGRCWAPYGARSTQKKMVTQPSHQPRWRGQNPLCRVTYRFV